MPGQLDREMLTASINGANVSINAAFAAVAGKRNYVSQLTLIVGGSTAGGNIDCTLTNANGITMHWELASPVGPLVQPDQVVLHFDPPIPATTPNVAMTASIPAIGAGNVTASIEMVGFRLPEP